MKNANTIRAGLFVMIALVIIVVASLWVAGKSFGGDQIGYGVEMKTAAGIRRGDRVRVSGMEAGRVIDVQLRAGEPWPVLFEIALDEGVPVTMSASARLTADGLLGAPYLEIDPGPAGATALPAGSIIPGTEVAGANEAFRSLGELSGQAGSALDEMTILVQSLGEKIGPLLARFELLLSDENLASISGSLAAMKDTMEESGPRLSALLIRLDELAVELSTGVEGLPQVTAEVEGLMTDLRTALGPDGQRVSILLESANSGLRSMQMNRGELEAMVRDLRLATANLRAFTESIKERPSLLVRKSRESDRKPGEGVDQ